MVSVSDQNPEIRRQTDVQQPSANTSTPVQQDNNAGIFRVGLTSAQAKSEGLSSLFTKYNTEDDDVISQSEFDAYTKETSNEQQQDITSKSGKRIAVGGVYTVQSGDTLSKIAQDFGVALLPLYQANKAVIGNDANKIKVGQKLTIKSTNTADSSKPTGTDETSDPTKSGGSSSTNVSSEFTETQISAFNNIKNILNAMGFEINSIEDMQVLQDKIKSVPDKVKGQVVKAMLADFVDPEKVIEEYVGKPITSIIEILDINAEEWHKASPDKKGIMLAKAADKRFQADLDENNPESLYSQELERINRGEFTKKERELYKVDLNNLTDDQKKDLAKISVMQRYQATVAAMTTDNIENGDNGNAAIMMDAFMQSMFADANISNVFVSFAKMSGSFNKEQVVNLFNTYSTHYTGGENVDEGYEALALIGAAEYADEDKLKILYQNNPSLESKLNDALNYVIENTTDESRKATLNGIVENSTSIVQGNSPTSATQGSTGGQGSSTNINNVSGVTNPIQQNVLQTNLVSDLKKASEEFHKQTENSYESNIPKGYETKIKRAEEYINFKGTGMTMAEYQRAKAALKANISDINDLIADIGKNPKLKDFAYMVFTRMDNNKSGELYLNASEEVRAFMNKNGYMNNEKLLQYVRLHPAEVKDAPKTVQTMIKELQEEDAIKQS